MLAFVLLTVDSHHEQHILETLSAMEEILEVRILFGEWDMICKVKADNPESLATFVMEKIRSIPGVSLTSTMIAVQ